MRLFSLSITVEKRESDIMKSNCILLEVFVVVV